MVECDFIREKKIRILVRETLSMLPMKGVNIQYGNAEALSEEILTTDEAGVVEFCWPRLSQVYVSPQKIDCVFSTSLSKKEKGDYEGWGASAMWVKAPGMATFFYGIIKPPEIPTPVEVIDDAKKVVDDVVEKVADVICKTEAEPIVPKSLSAYFPISIRNAKWICDGKPENITGTGIIKINGIEITEIPIRNGYGSPKNLENIEEFKKILKGLV